MLCSCLGAFLLPFPSGMCWFGLAICLLGVFAPCTLGLGVLAAGLLVCAAGSQSWVECLRFWSWALPLELLNCEAA